MININEIEEDLKKKISIEDNLEYLVQIIPELQKENPEQCLNYTALAIEYAKELQNRNDEIWATIYKAHCLLDLGFIKEAHQIYEEAYQKASQICEYDILYLAYQHYAVSFYYLGKLENSLFHLQILKQFTVENKNISHQAWVLNTIGFIYKEQSKLDESLKYFIDAQKLYEQLNDDKSLSDVLNNIGDVYNRLQYLEKAVYFYNKALTLKEKINDLLGLSDCLNNIGVIEVESNNLEEALKKFYQAYEILKKINYPSKVVRTLQNIATTYAEFDKNDDALNTFEEALNLSRKLNYKNIIPTILNNMALIQIKLKKFEEAQHCLEEAHKLSLEFDSQEDFINSLENYSELFSALHDYENAYNYKSEALKHYKEIFNEKTQKKFAEVQIQYDLENKEKEAEIYRLRNVELVKLNQKISEQKNLLELKNKQLEDSFEKLKKSQDELIKLERQNSALAMAVTANHELNQPMMIIKGNIEMLEINLEKNNISANEKKYLQQMNKAIDRMSKILEKFRNITNITFEEYAENTNMVSISKEDT